MKKTAALLMAVLLSTGLVACGTDQEGDASQMPSETAQTTQEAPQTGSQALPDDPQQPTAGSPADGTQQAESEQTENTQTESQTATEEQSGYEDNFAVDSIAAAEFADKIKTAVAAKDLEALADLTSYPVYVGIAESSVSSREELIELPRRFLPAWPALYCRMEEQLILFLAWWTESWQFRELIISNCRMQRMSV